MIIQVMCILSGNRKWIFEKFEEMSATLRICRKENGTLQKLIFIWRTFPELGEKGYVLRFQKLMSLFQYLKCYLLMKKFERTSTLVPALIWLSFVKWSSEQNSIWNLSLQILLQMLTPHTKRVMGSQTCTPLLIPSYHMQLFEYTKKA